MKTSNTLAVMSLVVSAITTLVWGTVNNMEPLPVWFFWTILISTVITAVASYLCLPKERHEINFASISITAHVFGGLVALVVHYN